MKSNYSPEEIFVDNFAGGGGASTGIELAIGRSVEEAINHDPAAIAMHEANHPETRHWCESVWDVDPVVVAAGRPVGLAWFSPDCKHFSKAKGSKPVDKTIRGLAWVAVRYAATVRPRVIMLENVEEFQTWGPLKKDEKGDYYPDPAQKGRTFNSFVNALKRLGYQVEWKELRACDYGAPTIRKRLFLLARCDGKPIVFPEPTHGPEGSGLLPYKTAADIIDWSIPCPSIFERKKELADNTKRRIARGIMKFVVNDPNPFIVRIGQTGFGGDRLQYSIDDPLTTITTKAEHLLVTPVLGVNTSGHPGSKVDEPLRTVTTGNHHMLVVPHITKFRTGATGHSLNEPLHTITSGQGSKRPAGAAHAMGMVAAFLAQYHTETTANGVRGQSLNDPVLTQDTSNRFALVTSHLMTMRNNMIGQDMRQPISTITASGAHHAEVRAFLIAYYGSSVGQSLNDPLQTVVTKDRFGLVTIEGVDYQIVDIGMRMLEPHELYAAQGFPSNYIINGYQVNGKPVTKSDQVARCGNSVCPDLAEVLTEANLPEHCVGNGKVVAFERYKAPEHGQLQLSI
ncbi:DNA cytosine methyltransferase [Paenibacillus camelliae]|uniref:DNA cytosine methyltransferase n=1 Tax=Paenibacillus camelliae TaxID=512410 RepID=UPI003D816F2D